jgi:esterase/lipase superfamily enzyme
VFSADEFVKWIDDLYAHSMGTWTIVEEMQRESNGSYGRLNSQLRL